MPQVIDSSEIGYEVVTMSQGKLATDSYHEMTCEAPEGKVVVGAGYSIVGFSNCNVLIFKPDIVDGRPTGWNISAYYPTAPGQAWTITMWVFCVRA